MADAFNTGSQNSNPLSTDRSSELAASISANLQSSAKNKLPGPSSLSALQRQKVGSGFDSAPASNLGNARRVRGSNVPSPDASQSVPPGNQMGEFTTSYEPKNRTRTFLNYLSAHTKNAGEYYSADDWV